MKTIFKSLSSVSFKLVLALLFLICGKTMAQTVIFSESMGTPAATTLVTLYTGWQNPSLIFSNGAQASTADVRTSNASTGYTGASGGGNVFYTGVGNAVGGFSIENINAASFSNLTIDYAYRKESATAFAPFSVDYWNGTAWVTIANTSATLFTQAANSAIGWYAAKTLSLPADAQINGLKLRFVRTNVGATTNTIRIDDVVLKGVGAGVNVNSASFNGNFGFFRPGNSSPSSSFTIQGISLAQNLTVTPPAGFEMRTGSNPFSTSPITFTPTAGNVPTTTIDVRCSPAAYQRYSGNISCVSGSYSVDLPVSGGGAIKSIAAGNWSNAAIWDGGVVPSSADHVYIDAYPVVIDNANANCMTIYFNPAVASGLLNMGSSTSRLNIYGDFNLGTGSQSVFSIWPTGAKLRFTGSAPVQTLAGWSTASPYAGGLNEVIVDKTEGKLTTAGNDMKLSIGTSLEVVSGQFALAAADDLFGRDAAGVSTQPTITIRSAGSFTIASGTTQINTGTSAASGAIGKIRVEGIAEISSRSTASPSSLNFGGMDVESGGSLVLGNNGWPTTATAFNPGVLTVKSGGSLKYADESQTFWNSTAQLNLEAGSAVVVPLVNKTPKLPGVFSDNGATWKFNYEGAQYSIPGNFSFKNLELSGSGTKTMQGPVSVTGKLSLMGTASLRDTASVPSLSYGANAVLEYGSATQSSAQITSSTEWPLTGALPPNVSIVNPSGVSLNSSKSTGNLTLNNGLLHLGDYNLSVASAQGGNSGNYVNTNGLGALSIRSIGATAAEFPVGNGTYTPAWITNAGISDDFSVKVKLASPCNVAASVARVWEISEAVNGGSDATIQLQWNQGEESTSFERSNAMIITCIGGTIGSVGSDGPSSGTGPYSKSIQNLSAFGDFGVARSFKDIGLLAMPSPTSGGCKTNKELISLQLKNYSANALNFALNNVTIVVSTNTGFSSSILFQTGVLAAGATMVVAMPDSIDLSAGGNFVFNATATLVGDFDLLNNSLLDQTILALPPATATVGYDQSSYCLSEGPVNVKFSGTTGGLFSTNQPGLMIDAASGAIDPSKSTAGDYVVSYTKAASEGCAAILTSTAVKINPLESAAFSYGTSTTFCQTGSNPVPVITGNAGGSFSATPTGLVMNSQTGEINLAASSINTYLVTYTTAGPCPVASSVSIAITNAPSASFGYANSSYCTNGDNPGPVYGNGASAGLFSSNLSGLSFVSTSTGQINLANSAAGTYTVTNTISASGGCAAAIANTTVTITKLPEATINYAGTPFCTTLSNAQAVTVSGTLGGGFDATPTGLSLNNQSGAILPSSSSTGTYTVQYTIAAAGGCEAVVANTILVINPLPVASITYPGSPYCSSITSAQPVTLTGAANGVFSSLTAGLSIDAQTGAIIPSSSTAGTYQVSYTLPASGGCPSVSINRAVTITAAPSASIAYTAAPYCGNGGLASVTRTGTAGGNYSSTAGLSINATSGEVNLNSSTPGTYTVTYTIPASSGCATFSTTASITVLPFSTAATGINSSLSASCGTATVNLSVVGGSLAPGASWVWYSGSCGGTKVGTGSSLNGVSVTTTTTFFVRAEGGSCSSTNCASKTITINPIPGITIDVVGDTSLLPGRTCTLNANATAGGAGNQYVWFLNGTQITGNSSSSLVVDVDKIGTYSVRVTTPEGCTAISGSRKITASGNDQVWVAPNPSKGLFKVRYYSRASVFNFTRTLYIFDQKGALVFTKTYPITNAYSSMDVDLRGYSSGMYQLMVRKANGDLLASGTVIIQ